MSQRYKAIEHLVVPSEQVSKLLEKLREIDDEENVIKEAILLPERVSRHLRGGAIRMNKETLIHYSNKPLLEVWSVPPAMQKAHFKPRGLWVSVEGDDDWKSWCLSEDYECQSLSNPHEIHLAKTANILRLSCSDQLRGFTKRYGLRFRSGSVIIDIDWPEVTSHYDGIIIAPYVWECRLDTTNTWYYSWDCASGCIWNASAVAKIVPLSQEEEIKTCRE